MENNHNFQQDQKESGQVDDTQVRDTAQQGQVNQPLFGGTPQETQQNQPLFGGTAQEAQQNQPLFSEQVQSNQPLFGGTAQEAQQNQPLFSEQVQSNQPLFGGTVQGGQQNQSGFSTEPRKKKKGVLITLVSIAVVITLIVLAAIGVFVLNKKTSEGPTPQPASSTEGGKKTEFTFEPIQSEKAVFKLQEIKRDVKVSKDIANSVVYIFEVENKGSNEIQYLTMEGQTKEGAIVHPVSNYDVENSSILENNKCKTSDSKIEKNQKEHVCVVYPISIEKLLVPVNIKKEIGYKPVVIDSETKKSENYVIEHKKKGEGVVEKGYDGEVEATTTISDIKEATNSYGDKIFAMDVSLSIAKDNKYGTRGYESIRVELEDGTFYREGYGDYKIDGTMSTSEFSKRLSEPVKKGDTIRHTVLFPKTDKKIKNIIFTTYDNKNRKEITTVFEQ